MHRFKRLPSELVDLFSWLFPLIAVPSAVESCDATKVNDRYMSATTTASTVHLERLLWGNNPHRLASAISCSGATRGVDTVDQWAFLICPWLPLREGLQVAIHIAEL
jgi:hypothetical protein